MLSNPKPNWQRTWHGLKGEALSLTHQPSHWYLEMSQECRTFELSLLIILVIACF